MGSVDKTMDSGWRGPRFKSVGGDSSALGQGTIYPHCLVPWKGLKVVGPLVVCLNAACWLSGQVKYRNTDINFINC